eukprot:scaffold9.g3218.t1
MAAPGGLRVLVGQGLDCVDGAVPQHHFVTLPDPKTGQPASYLLTPTGLQELNHHRPQFGSWFVDESVVRYGGLYVATPVDPLLILLPLLEEARGANGAGVGVFCDLEQMLSPLGQASAHLLAPLLAPAAASSSSALECVCDWKEAGGQRYYRLSEARALAWLRCKVGAAAAALRTTHAPAFEGMDDAALSAYAAGLMGEYLSRAWRDRLAQARPEAGGVRALGLPSEEQAAAAAAAATAVVRAASWEPGHPPSDHKRVRLDPKEAAKQKAAQKRQEEKAAKAAKEAAGMRKLSSFFKPKPKA